MAETLRIEIPIETIDETADGLNAAIQGLKKLEQVYENASQAAGKARSGVSKFDEQAEKTEKSLAKWAKEKYEILLEAKDRISPILSTLGNGLRSIAGKTWNITMRAFDFVTSPVRGIINLLKNPVFQVGAVLGVSSGLKDTIETYKDFEAAMSQVQAISGATSAELTDLTNKAKEMGSTTKFTAAESAEAFNYMAMAGWKTKDMLSGIEGILSLAAASGEDLATTSDIVTDALTAFNMKASDAGRFSDVLAAAASNANTTVSGMGETFKYAGAMAGSLRYSIEDVALMTGLMANSGIKGTMSGTSLNTIFTRLSTNTNGAADAMSDLGIAFFTSEGNARDLSDVMDELREATAGMTAEQKSQIANTIAGMEAQKGLLAILNASEEDYNKLADAINNADGAAAQMSDTMLDNLHGSITLLQSAVDGVKISFGERLSPYVKGIAEWLTAQMPAIEQGLNEFMDGLDAGIDRMQRKFDGIRATVKWQDAGIFGKAHILWDEFIAEPFSDWWNSKGKAKFAGYAQNIGEGIGTGLKLGIMTLLGIDISETLDEGVSIGASFARGFSEGFDFNMISEKLFQGFGNMFSNAGKLLPGGQAADLSSLFSAVMLAKLAKPLISLLGGSYKFGKAIGGSDLLGSFSVAEELAGTGAAGGSGLLGLLGNAGMALGSGASSGTGLVLAGAGGIAGGVASGATLISGGIDLYKAFKSDNAEESNVYGESAAWKMGGVATGAMIGSMILPGLGTLIGGGLGGILGWIKGNSIKKDYQKELEEIEKKAAKIQAVYEATGVAIDDVVFANKELNDALEDTELSAAEFARMFQESCADVMSDAFGDIKLSLADIKKLAEEITFAGMKDGWDTFNTAVSDTEIALTSLQGTITALKKENWLVSLGAELSEADMSGYKASVDQFVSAAQQYITNSHYEATLGFDILTGGKSRTGAVRRDPDAIGAVAFGYEPEEELDTGWIDSYYGSLQERIAELGAQLSESVEIALSDGIITLDESKEITNLQGQITEITDKLSQAREDAQMQALQIKYSGAALTPESFMQLQEELHAQAQSLEDSAFNALGGTLTNLNMARENGDINQQEYQRLFDEANAAYQEQINEANARMQSFQMDTIAGAYGDMGLDGILPDLEGTLSERLGEAMNRAVAIKPDVSLWTAEDVVKWFDLDGLSGEVQENMVQLLTLAAASVPDRLAIGLHEDLVAGFDVDELVENAAMLSPIGGRYSDAFLNGMLDGISAGETSIRSTAEETLENVFADDFNVSARINVTPDFSSFYTPSGQNPLSYTQIDTSLFPVSEHAAGGYARGKQLSWLAEEGYGEFVIPTNPSRRTRALELYEQAGAALGVAAYADGGYVGVPAGENTPVYQEAPAASDPAGMSVQISVDMTPEFIIQGGADQSEEDIMQVIRRHMKEMADELGGEIAVKLEEVFSNMPKAKEA
ncbi:MAG: phage tail tape measure protein [Clostridium sp.]|nr:phage tail tape measure protein [Clostridium sp.]